MSDFPSTLLPILSELDPDSANIVILNHIPGLSASMRTSLYHRLGTEPELQRALSEFRVHLSVPRLMFALGAIEGSRKKSIPSVGRSVLIPDIETKPQPKSTPRAAVTTRSHTRTATSTSSPETTSPEPDGRKKLWENLQVHERRISNVNAEFQLFLKKSLNIDAKYPIGDSAEDSRSKLGGSATSRKACDESGEKQELSFARRSESTGEDENNSLSQREFTATYETDELFKKYTSPSPIKPSKGPSLSTKSNPVLALSHRTLLRYVDLAKILPRLCLPGKQRFIDIVSDAVYAVMQKDPPVETLHKALGDSGEIAGALSLFCNSDSVQTRLAAAFNHMNVETAPISAITQTQLRRFLVAVFAAQLRLSPGLARNTGVTAAELAELTAAQCFEEVANGAAAIRVEDFVGWFGGEKGHRRRLVNMQSQPEEIL